MSTPCDFLRVEGKTKRAEETVSVLGKRISSVNFGDIQIIERGVVIIYTCKIIIKVILYV